MNVYECNGRRGDRKIEYILYFSQNENILSITRMETFRISIIWRQNILKGDLPFKKLSIVFLVF